MRARHRRRAVARAAAVDAHGAAEGAGRHHACRASLAAIAVEGNAIRVGAARAAGGAAGLARTGRTPAAARRRRCPGSATRRPARAARSAARSRTPIRARRLPLALLALGASVELSSQGRAAARSGGRFLHRPDVDRAQRRRADRGGRHSPAARPVMASRSASSRAATAISPSSPARRLRTRDGVRLAIGGVADRPDRARFPDIDGDALDDALDAFRRRARRRATTCMPPPTIAASWCASSAAPPSRRPVDAAPERRRAPHVSASSSTAVRSRARPSRACCSPTSCAMSSA